MDSIGLKRYINLRRPQYALSKKPIIDLFAQKGKSSTGFTQFGPIYQIFMYAFFIGYHLEERVPLPTEAKERTEFLEIGKWNPNEMVNYILMLLLCKKDIVGKEWHEIEDLEEEEVTKIFSGLIKAMEEYANAGFSYIEEVLNDRSNEFQDPYVFANLLKEVVDKTNKE